MLVSPDHLLFSSFSFLFSGGWDGELRCWVKYGDVSEGSLVITCYEFFSDQFNLPGFARIEVLVGTIGLENVL